MSIGAAAADGSQIPGEVTVEARREGHVAVVDDALRVADWRTRTPEIVRWFADRVDEDEDLAASLELALKVGVVALSTVGVSVNVDYVEKEFARFSTQLESSLEQRLSQLESAFEDVFSDGDGQLAQALGTYLGEGGQLAELFDPNRRDSAVSRIREILADHFDGETSTLHRLLDVTDASSPLATWRDEMSGQFERLRRLIDDYRRELSEAAAAQVAAVQARADEHEKGTQKGREFEEQVFEAINGCAGVCGDVAEPTGDAVGSGTSKLGDVVVTVNPRDTRGAEVRIVFEAKDKAVGLTPILRELDGAKKNRGAVAAVAVYSRDAHMPTGSAPFREQGQGRYLALLDKDTDDPLVVQLAYRIARFWALVELTTDDGEVDVRGIRDDLESARHQLQNVSTAKRKLTTLRRSVDEMAGGVEAQLEELRAGLIEALDRIDARIRLSGD